VEKFSETVNRGDEVLVYVTGKCLQMGNQYLFVPSGAKLPEFPTTAEERKAA
jgi:hypothetical protein